MGEGFDLRDVPGARAIGEQKSRHREGVTVILDQ